MGMGMDNDVGLRRVARDGGVESETGFVGMVMMKTLRRTARGMVGGYGWKL